MSQSRVGYVRRQFMKVAASIGGVAVAGCTGEVVDEDEPTQSHDGATASTQPTFRLLISDMPADIGDFDSLEVTFDGARVFKRNGKETERGDDDEEGDHGGEENEEHGDSDAAEDGEETESDELEDSVNGDDGAAQEPSDEDDSGSDEDDQTDDDEADSAEETENSEDDEDNSVDSDDEDTESEDSSEDSVDPDDDHAGSEDGDDDPGDDEDEEPPDAERDEESSIERVQWNNGFYEIDLDPEVHTSTVDLTEVIGDQAIAIFEGDLSPGQYNKIELQVKDTQAELANEQEGVEAEVMVPSDRLRITTPFELKAETTVDFVFDINVVRRGNTGRYNLIPVISGSGVNGDRVQVEEIGGGSENPGQANTSQPGGPPADHERGNTSRGREENSPPGQSPDRERGPPMRSR